jgi:hypothetical protein
MTATGCQRRSRCVAGPGLRSPSQDRFRTDDRVRTRSSLREFGERRTDVRVSTSCTNTCSHTCDGMSIVYVRKPIATAGLEHSTVSRTARGLQFRCLRALWSADAWSRCSVDRHDRERSVRGVQVHRPWPGDEHRDATSNAMSDPSRVAGDGGGAITPYQGLHQ